MSDAETVLKDAHLLGLTLRRDGDRIVVAPGRLCPPGFLAKLRANKQAVMDLLEATDCQLTTDCAPWFHIARQILAGEFDQADGSTTQSLIIGLRSIPHPRCREALGRLQGRQAEPTKDR